MGKNMTNQEKDFIETLSTSIRSSRPIMWVETNEEMRAYRLVLEAARVTGREILSWRFLSGLVDSEMKPVDGTFGAVDALSHILRRNGNSLYVFFDLHHHMRGSEINQDGPGVIRRLKDIFESFKQSESILVIISPCEMPAEEIKSNLRSMKLPLPDVAVFKQTLLREIEKYGYLKAGKNEKEQIALALLGLTYEEAEDVLAMEVARNGKIDISVLPEIIKVRAERVKGIRGLEVVMPDPLLPTVGGLDNVKTWIEEAFIGFTKEGQEGGIEPPLGAVFAGVPGVGKSLAAKVVGRDSGMLLIRFDIGAIFEKWVGASEGNQRRAFATIEACAPCLVWMEELEKALKKSGHDGDSTTPRIQGEFLRWLQERRPGIFIMATMNDVLGVRPELIRKQRFDEIFFVNLPEECERKEIFAIHLKKRKKKLKDFDLDTLANESKGYTGAEIESAIRAALRSSFAKKEIMTTHHIVQALKESAPLSVTRADEIQELLDWATRAQARPASSHSGKELR